MTHHLYGATETLIIRGQSQAKKRVILFLTVFVVTGFFSKSELCTNYCLDFNGYYLCALFQIYFCHLQYQLMKFVACLKQLPITFAKSSLFHPFHSVYTCYRYVQLL